MVNEKLPGNRWLHLGTGNARTCIMANFLQRKPE